MDGDQPHMVPTATDRVVWMVCAFRNVDGAAEVGAFFAQNCLISASFLFNPYTQVLNGCYPKEALNATSYHCGVRPLYCSVAQRRTEAQNTAQDGTTQYLKGNAFVVSNNYELEISSLSQSPHSKRKKSNKMNPINEAIERGVKASVIAFATSLSTSKARQITSVALIASSRTRQKATPSKRPRLNNGSKTNSSKRGSADWIHARALTNTQTNEFYAEWSQGDKRFFRQGI